MDFHVGDRVKLKAEFVKKYEDVLTDDLLSSSGTMRVLKTYESYDTGMETRHEMVVCSYNDKGGRLHIVPWCRETLDPVIENPPKC